MAIDVRSEKSEGFSLIEVLMALIILAFGLLAVSQPIYIATRSDSLARSQGTAALAAQNKLEHLAHLHHQNPSADELALGSHGPQETEVTNPIDGATLNRYKVTWVVSNVLDPRPGKVSGARFVTVTVAPIGTDGSENNQAFFNKVVNAATVFSPKFP